LRDAQCKKSCREGFKETRGLFLERKFFDNEGPLALQDDEKQAVPQFGLRLIVGTTGIAASPPLN